jgi:carboxypeptidase Taq
MTDAPSAYANLIERCKEISILGSCASLLSWDRETYMPAGATNTGRRKWPASADWFTRNSPRPRWANGWPNARRRRWARPRNRTREPTCASCGGNITRKRSSPAPGGRDGRVESLAQTAWIEAREKSQFSLFQPWLEKIVALKREQADCYGFKRERYDALMDDYEPGETAERIARVFGDLAPRLADLVRRIQNAPRKPEPSILKRSFPVDRQRILGEMAASAFGFDFSQGRLDEVVHPFCTTIGPGDVRLTTRFNREFFNESFFGILHECGHGLYEQGLPSEHFGTPLGETVSLGIHESQSRMWENFVGRSPAFWRFFFPRARGIFHEALRDVELNAFVHAVNEVRPSWIRVEADEVTYNLHIILRFEIEREMIAGRLEPKDVPPAWNARFAELFGLEVPDDRQGCLQDTHWAIGALGYFPTYCLGNLYAAQFFEQARKDLPGLEEGFTRGEFLPLLDWLRKNIHRHGMRYRAGDLVQNVTGQPRSPEPLMAYLESKFSLLYGI